MMARRTPAHVLRFEIRDETGDRRQERKGGETRDGAAVARPPFAQSAPLVEREPRGLLDPVDVTRPREGGRETRRKRSPIREHSRVSGLLRVSGEEGAKRVCRCPRRATRRFRLCRLQRLKPLALCAGATSAKETQTRHCLICSKRRLEQKTLLCT